MLKNTNIISGSLNMDGCSYNKMSLKKGNLFYISNEFDLKKYRDLINEGLFRNAILETDIYVTDKWLPIGTKYNPFCGTFDGGGFSISFTCKDKNTDTFTSSFFGFTHDAFIVNLNVNANIISAKENASGLVHYSGSNITIKKCTINVIYMFTSKVYDNDFGGLIGLHGESGNIKIDSCVFIGIIERLDDIAISVGGFIGWDAISVNCNISNSYVSLRTLTKDHKTQGQNYFRCPFCLDSNVRISNCYYLKRIGNSKQGEKIDEVEFCRHKRILL